MQSESRHTERTYVSWSPFVGQPQKGKVIVFSKCCRRWWGVGVFHASRDGRGLGSNPQVLWSQLQGGMYVSNVNELHKSVNSINAK